jgi:hypothetical protein
MRRYQSYQHFYAAYDLTHVYARAIGTGKTGAENATCILATTATTVLVALEISPRGTIAL